MSVCSECKGTGIYVGIGFHPPEPCRACKGPAGPSQEVKRQTGPQGDPSNPVFFSLNEWSHRRLYEYVRFSMNELYTFTLMDPSEFRYVYLLGQKNDSTGFISYNAVVPKEPLETILRGIQSGAMTYPVWAVYERVSMDSDIYKLAWDGRK